MNQLTINKIILPLSILSFIEFIYLIFNNINGNYSLLPLLPLFNALLFYITSIIVGNKLAHIGNILILSLLFVKNSLIPLFTFLGNYNTIMKLNIEYNANRAILLMLYEMFAIMLMFIYVNRKQFKSIVYRLDNDTSMKKIVVALSLYCCFIFIMFPDVFFSFKTIFNLSDENFTVGFHNDLAFGSIQRILRTLFGVVFNVVRILLPVMIIRFLFRKRMNLIVESFIISTLIFLQFLFITSTFAESIVSSLIVLLAVIKMRPKMYGPILKISAISVSFIIIFYFSFRYAIIGTKSRYAGSSFVEYCCSVMNAYFGGIDNVAAVFNVPDTDVMTNFLNTLKCTVPFNTTFFGEHGMIYTSLYNISNFSMGQIPPTLTSSCYYFGTLFSPIISVIFVYISIKYSYLALKMNSYWQYISYVFISIIFALGISMYNDQISLTWFNGWALPILILSNISSKKISYNENKL